MITDIALKILAGICVGAGLHHLVAGLRGYRSPVNIFFAIMCLTVAGIALLSGRIYQATSVSQYETTADLFFVALAVYNAAFIWFVTSYAGITSRRISIALTVACGAWFVLAISGAITEVIRLHDVRLTWGETVVTADTTVTPALLYVALVGAAIYGYVFHACLVLNRRGEHRPALSLAVGSLILVIAIAHDVLLSRHVFGGMYLAEYGFLSMVLIMTTWITNDFVSASRITRSLIESEERFRELAELLPNTVFELDTSGSITYANRAGLEMFGYDEADLVSKHGLDMICQEERQVASGRLSAILSGEEIGMFEYTAVRKDGSRFPAMLQSAAILRHGTVAGVRGVAIDMSDKKLLENELQQTRKMEAVGTLAGGIAHDFNNILSAILGYSELAMTQLENDKAAQRDIQKVIQSGERARDLVRQILTFSRQTDLKPRAIELRTAVRECLDLLRATLPSTIQIETRLTSEATVIADPTQIHQIVVNLSTNAAHAMEQAGTLVVELNDVSRTPGGGGQQDSEAVRLTVRDSGHGIEPHVKERMFEPFYTTSDSPQGTGLGLSMVYGITKQLGATVLVESTPGVGSAFHVEIPRARAGQAAGEDDAGAMPGGTERILFIDDEEMLALLALRTLSELGYNVTVATDADSALRTFRENPGSFDIVVSDMTMPHMTGLTVANKMLSIRPDVPIILCTGFSEQLSGVDVEAYGIRRLVMKPLRQRDLACHVRDVLDGVPSDIIGQRHS